MIHLRLRSEYSFGRAYGRVEQVLEAAGGPMAAITDNGTWGHVPFFKAAKKAGIRPILGAEIAVVEDSRSRERQTYVLMAFLAKNREGLRELYDLVTLANRMFYFVPRIDYNDVATVSDNLVVLSGPNANVEYLTPAPNLYLEMMPGYDSWNRKVMGLKGFNRVITCDNLYPRVTDREAYEIVAFRNRDSRVNGLHIMNEWELRLAVPEADDDAFLNSDRIGAEITLEDLPQASMVKKDWGATLYEKCMEGSLKRGMNVEIVGKLRLKDKVYRERLDRELDMIAEKGFEDYFFVIADMVSRAKETMMVGPARGSAAGSLVCFLMGITDVDPIVHDLMFERFIDVTRADLPDVDLDFPDVKRERVIAALGEMYGPERVGRIGTINRYKAKSCLGIVAKELSIPPYEINDVKGAMVERSGGDARAQFCVRDTLDSLEIGRALLAKYPALNIAAEMEGHANHSGMHAAGVLVVNDDITNYCAIDRSGAAQLDKHDAEALNMLKIDVLGLRTLSVLEDCLEQIGKEKEWLVDYPLDDQEAFEVLNAEKFSGIFQFEGYALQSLTRQMKIRDFNDIVAITSLARPGPLHCGAAGEFVARRVGTEKVVSLHPLVEDLLAESYGTVIYQEQVMAIGRVMGKLSWEDVSSLRKAMSKSLGDEFFNRYWEKFEKGAKSQGIPSAEARRVWDKICTFGSWAFNKSHAVSYGLISYWCSVLKAHYPLQFAAATLRNEKDTEQGVKILRELSNEGFHYKPVDPKRSGLTWSVVDGTLVGGLTNIKGIGQRTAEDIIERRESNRPLMPGQIKKLMTPVTPYDDIFEGQRRFKEMYDNPKEFNIKSGGISFISDISDPGEYVVLARVQEKNLRDMNEHDALAKRSGRKITRNNLFLNLTLEDDTGSIKAKVTRYKYAEYGKPLVEGARIGDWYLFKGRIQDSEWRILYIDKWRRLEGDPRFPDKL
jgi:DNA polymerase III alpha subunit